MLKVLFLPPIFFRNVLAPNTGRIFGKFFRQPKIQGKGLALRPPTKMPPHSSRCCPLPFAPGGYLTFVYIPLRRIRWCDRSFRAASATRNLLRWTDAT